MGTNAATIAFDTIESLVDEKADQSDAGCPSCAEVMDRINRAPGLTDQLRRDLRSAVTRVICRWLGKDLITTAADLKALSLEMKDWTGVRFGIAESTLQTTLSTFKRAFIVAGVVPGRPAELTQPWQLLANILAARWNSRADDSHYRSVKLQSFMRWCSRECIEPDQVDENAIAGFIENERRIRATRVSEREVSLRSAWNKAARELAGWPTITISSRPSAKVQRFWSFKEEQFPRSFIDEIDRYLGAGGFLNQAGQGLSYMDSLLTFAPLPGETTGNPSISDDQIVATSSRSKGPLADATAKMHRHYLFRCASAMVDMRVKSLEEIRTIRDVVCFEGLRALMVLTERERRSSCERTPHAKQQIMGLFAVAVRCGFTYSDSEWNAILRLRENVKEAVETKPDEMTEKNLQRLLQFDDPDNFARLAALAHVEMDELEAIRAKTGIVTEKMAKRASTAIAVLIELRLPVRIRTLGSTQWKNLRKPTRRGGNASLHYEAAQLKTRVPVDIDIPADEWALIETYSQRYRPHLSGAKQSEYLFPADNKTGQIRLGTLSARIRQLVLRRTGMSFTPHNFRHIAADKLPEEEAGGILVHAENSRAKKAYRRKKVRQAVDQYAEIRAPARERGISLFRTGSRRTRRNALSPKKKPSDVSE